MKVIEPGHVYELNQVDAPAGETQRLVFVNREDAPHPGTQTQEVLRALIDRTIHCDNCLRWDGNDRIVYHLRMALALHEARHLERMVEKGAAIEQVQTSAHDGHLAIKDEPHVWVEARFERWKAGLQSSPWRS